MIVNVKTSDILNAANWCDDYMGQADRYLVDENKWNYLGAGDFVIRDEEIALLFIICWGGTVVNNHDKN